MAVRAKLPIIALGAAFALSACAKRSKSEAAPTLTSEPAPVASAAPPRSEPAASAMPPQVVPRRLPDPLDDSVVGVMSGLGADASGSDAERVVAGLRFGFRKCYQDSLKKDPDASGRIRLTIEVDEKGKVKSASSFVTGKLPKTAGTCVENHARTAEFAPPDGGSATIVVPLMFTKA